MTLYTVEQVAEILKVHPVTVRKWIAARQIPFYKLSGKAVRISDRQIETYLKKREVRMDML